LDTARLEALDDVGSGGSLLELRVLDVVPAGALVDFTGLGVVLPLATVEIVMTGPLDDDDEDNDDWDDNEFNEDDTDDDDDDDEDAPPNVPASAMLPCVETDVATFDSPAAALAEPVDEVSEVLPAGSVGSAAPMTVSRIGDDVVPAADDDWVVEAVVLIDKSLAILDGADTGI
jgi:hypothetical protein